MTDAVEGEIVSPDTTVNLTKHPERTVSLLEMAFHNMFNITEACQYAGISRETYYQWLADDDIFSYRMSVAQQAPSKKAKENILTALNEGDTGISRWYLERKDPEFMPKAKVTSDPEERATREKIREFLDDTNDSDDASSEPPAADSAEARGEVAEAPTDIS